ncbi:MAG TPA: TlpA disulfide reductase family protein [Chitinophaga sp.]|uniref:TlpA disulfide reductase family protein n=1 Tax=Chitinophaga sp. TaxID=1869181 RepID=UPI002F935C02
MKRKNLLSGILLISLSSLSLAAQAQNTILSGQLKGSSGANIEISYRKNGVFKMDTIAAVNDHFTWKVNLSEPQLISLSVNGYANSFFIEPGHINITRTKDVTGSYTITGSPTQHDAEVFGASLEEINNQQNQVYATSRKETAEEKAELEKKIQALREEKTNKANEFIATHPKSFYSLYMIDGRTSYNEYSEIKPLYDKLDKSLKQSESGKKLLQKLQRLEKCQLGSQMINFVQRDSSGVPVKFNSFKGKYVLVDFWASWCKPCRAENPNVLKAYNAFKDKGFTVIGISLDDKAANWRKAIRDDKMPWTQLSDLKGWKNEVSTNFGIESIPRNLLVDPSGKIVAKDLRGAALENKLKELLN